MESLEHPTAMQLCSAVQYNEEMSLCLSFCPSVKSNSLSGFLFRCIDETCLKQVLAA